MKLRTKLLLNLQAVSLVTGGIIAALSVFSATESLEKKALEQLESVREIKKAGIHRYFENVKNQIQTLALSRDTVAALTEFEVASAKYLQEKGASESLIESQRQSLARYYDSSFLSQIPNHIEGNAKQGKTFTHHLSDVGVLLQSAFIKDNPYPLGEKHQLESPDEQTSYADIHRKAHPYFSEYLQTFGYYDIFLVDAKSGTVMYSVFKEVDYFTSLKTGAFSQSGLARAYQSAMQLPQGGSPAFIDFSRYQPSYNAPAGFVAMPVFDGDEKTGVLIFQFAIAELNNIMAERSGLGETGETYLVGSDHLMRSDSYLDPENHSVEASFRNPELGKVSTDGVIRALQGVSNTQVILDYNGNQVLSAYSPITLFGLSWAILAEIDLAEAMSDVYGLQTQMLIVFVGCAFIVVPLGIYISSGITKPMGGEPSEMVSIAKSVSEKDLSLNFDEKISSETVYGSMRNMSLNLKEIAGHLSQSSQMLASAAEESSQTTHQTLRAIEQQRSGTDNVASAINQLLTSVQSVATSTADTARMTKDAQEQVRKGALQINSTSETVEELVKQMAESGEVVEELFEESQKVSTILNAIQAISEQTNLLALNAAIEAARAGENGRGFSVVADEVRTLAMKTQESVVDIQDIVASIQTRAGQAIKTMEKSQSHVITTSDFTEQSQRVFVDIQALVEQIGHMTDHIADVTEQQTQTMGEVDQHIVTIKELADQTYGGAKEINGSSANVASAAEELSEVVRQFRF